MRKTLIATALAGFVSLCAFAAPEGSPSLYFHSDAFAQIGSDNRFSFLIGVKEPGNYTFVDGAGSQDVQLVPVTVDSEGNYLGTWVSLSVNAEGGISVYGDASNIDVIIANGGYVTEVDLSSCTDLDILDLEHNALQKLDLTPFTKLEAIYLSDNPFTAETPLVIGAPKDYLQILEVDIVDHMDQNFNLSDYPNLVVFDGYHNMTLKNVDPTGCPELMSLSVEMTQCESLDVTQNPKLYSLNISESRITQIDLSQNPELVHFYASHDSGFVNTDVKLQDIDLSHNPKLQTLVIGGNGFESVDLSHNTLLNRVNLKRNALTSLNLDNNPDIVSLNIMDNNFDFATLPLPGVNWVEYFYRQNPMPVARSIKAGSSIDLSSRVLREGGVTSARVWRRVVGGENTLLDESDYSYVNGVITFPKALTDSVYVEFANTLFTDYTITTSSFMVKSEADFGQPSRIVSFISSDSRPVSFTVGMAGASEANPKTIYVDWGNGTRVPFTITADVDLDAAANISGMPSGQVSIYVPEEEVLTMLVMDEVPLASINLNNATELAALSLSGCGLYEIDTQYNRCLRHLDVSDNQLRTLNLAGVYGDYEKNVLSTIDASDNMLFSYSNIATRSTVNLDLSGNQLETIDLKNYDQLVNLDLSGNKLTSVDLDHLAVAENVDLSDNEIKEINTCKSHAPANFNVTDNRLTYISLPDPASQCDGYLYAPQKKIVIPEQAPIINLSDEMAAVNGIPTSITWKKADGTVLTEGTDYICTDGATTFLNASLGRVYAELTNSGFPQLADENVLATTETQVVGAPTHTVASFTTLGGQGSVIFAATEPMQLYIDWNGDRSNMTAYEVGTSYQEYPVESVSPNTKVNIFASNADDAAKVNVFSIYGLKLDDVDLSPLTGVYSLNIGGAGIDEDDIVMPVAPGLGELTLTGNNFSSYPYAEKYPNLHNLNISDNKLAQFDCSAVPSVDYLVISGNQITDLNLAGSNAWSVMAERNQIESVELEGANNLEQLVLTENLLSEIDIESVKNTLNAIVLVGNRFTFATLAHLLDYPSLSIFYYGNQAPMDVECIDGKVDLSSQAMVNGTPTAFAWYVGVPEYDDDGQLVGNLLTEGVDYTIENGVTTFINFPKDEVMCLMTNDELPNLLLYTNLLRVAGINGIEADDADAPIYTLQGLRVTDASRLRPGIYIRDHKKIVIK